jgi:hypothetical protein
MAIDSTKSKMAIYSYQRGCRVTKNGDVIGVRGKKRSVRVGYRGYKTFNMKNPETGVATPVLVHKLAAYQRFGVDAFREGIQVRHLNNDKTDNSLNNIDIGTQLDNVSDLPNNGKNLHGAKLNREQVKEIRRKAAIGIPYKEIVHDYPISSRGNVSDIVNGKTWQESFGEE